MILTVPVYFKNKRLLNILVLEQQTAMLIYVGSKELWVLNFNEVEIFEIFLWHYFKQELVNFSFIFTGTKNAIVDTTEHVYEPTTTEPTPDTKRKNFLLIYLHKED